MVSLWLGLMALLKKCFRISALWALESSRRHFLEVEGIAEVGGRDRDVAEVVEVSVSISY